MLYLIVYTCNFGYITNGPTQPYSQCRPVSASAGEYTPAIYSCEGRTILCNTSESILFNSVDLHYRRNPQLLRLGQCAVDVSRRIAGAVHYNFQRNTNDLFAWIRIE